jgi:integrase
MSRPRNTVPRFCIDATGRAFTKVNGRFISLGRGDSSESRTRYAAILADHAQGKLLHTARLTSVQPSSLTANQLLLQYATRELPRYSSAEQHCQKCAMKIARQMFGAVPVTDFGPLKLRLVRDAMVAGDPNARDKNGKPKPRKPWSRSFVNKQIKRLRAVFRWGVSWELVPQAVADALGSVRSLAIGQSTARETAPRLAVPHADITAVRGNLRERHRDVFDLLLLTGARPGEIVNLTTGMIDRTGEVWRCDLLKHKTTHKGKTRTLFFNATAQLILRKYLQADPDSRLFKFSRISFGNVVKAACGRAGVTPFVPHQLRYCVATKVANELDTESAQRLLGHSSRAMTEHYSRAADRKAVEAVKRLG